MYTVEYMAACTRGSNIEIFNIVNKLNTSTLNEVSSHSSIS